MQFSKTAKTLLSEITLRRVHEVIPRLFQSDKIAPVQLSHLIKNSSPSLPPQPWNF